MMVNVTHKIMNDSTTIDLLLSFYYYYPRYSRSKQQ